MKKLIGPTFEESHTRVSTGRYLTVIGTPENALLKRSHCIRYRSAESLAIPTSILPVEQYAMAGRVLNTVMVCILKLIITDRYINRLSRLVAKSDSMDEMVCILKHDELLISKF